MKHMDDERREQFDFNLAAPLPGHETARPSESVVEMEGAAFMAAMAQHQQITGQRG